MKASPHRFPLFRIATLAAVVLALALPTFAGWVGVGGAMRESTRTLAFASHAGTDYMFVGNKNYGVFVSTNGGVNWSPTGLDEFLLWAGRKEGVGAVNAVLAAPNYGTNPLLLACTTTGQVWYSTDHGMSWCQAWNLPGSPVTEMVIRGGTLYASTYGNGIYTAAVSAFGACYPPASFSRLTPLPCGTNRVMKVAFDAGGSLFACTESDGISTGGVYRWAGSVWESRNGGLPPGLHSYAALAFGLDGQPSPQPNSDLWLGSTDGSGLFYSPDKGLSWQQVPCYPCGMVLDIKPAPDYHPTAGHHLFWGTESGWYEGFGTMPSSFVCQSRLPVGLGVNSVVADPNWSITYPVVWLATTDGVRRIAPNAFPSPPDTGISNGLVMFDISWLAPSPAYNQFTSDGVVFAASENFGLFRSMDGGQTYHQFMTPLDGASHGANIQNRITSVAMHPFFNASGTCQSNDSTTMYMSLYKKGVYRSVAAGTLWVPVNGAGTTSLPVNPEVALLTHTPLVPLDGLYNLFAAVNTSTPALYRHTSPDNWDACQPLPPGSGDITALALPPNHDGTTGKADIFAGTEAGLFKHTQRGNPPVAWNAALFPPGAFGPVNAVAFHPTYPTPSTVYAARGGTGLFKSNDGGATFFASNAGITTCAVSPTYAWDFDNDGNTDSPDQTPTWTYLSQGLHTWKVTITLGGQSIVRTGEVRVYEAPPCILQSVAVSAYPSVDQAPATVSFDADAVLQACVGNETFQWTFGDGSPPSSEKDPTHIYTAHGTYNWTLTVSVPTTPFPTTYLYQGQVTVLGSTGCPWTAVASASRSAGAAPLTVNFTGAAYPYIDASAVTVSPTNGNQVAVGVNYPSRSSAGGVFVSLDGGNNFQPRNNGLVDRHVKSLAFAKAVSFGGSRLLCGTQKLQACYTDDAFSDGTPWIPAAGYKTTLGEIRSVVVSPVPPNYGCTPLGSEAGTDVFIAGSEGVFWSVDGGETFRPINQGLMTNTPSGCRPIDINCLMLFINPDTTTLGRATPMLLAGTNNFGIYYRYATTGSVSDPWDWTNGVWQLSNVTTGAIEKFARERTVFPLRAGASNGVWTSPGKDLSTFPYGEFWVNSGLSGVLDIRHGQAARVKERDPEAPSGSTSWGTINNQGVAKGTGSTWGRPEAITWELRNGATGTAGELPDKTYAQSVIQATSGTVLCGTKGEGTGVWRTEDEGTEYWERSSVGLESTSFDIQDFLEAQANTRTPPGYDLFCAINGTSSDGGIYYSGDDGRHWVNLSEGFDSSEQTLSSIVASEGDPPTYYAGTYSKGSYASTITMQEFPTVTALSTSTSTSTGGGTLTVSGTGFLSACPTGFSCNDSSAVVVFGTTDAPSTTWVSPTELQAEIPPHVAGTVTVSVRNPDTRAARYSGDFTFTDAGDPDFLVTMNRNGSGQVVVTWVNAPTSGLRKIYRSPEPDFSAQRSSADGTGTDGSYTWEDATGTDSYLYFYKIE